MDNTYANVPFKQYASPLTEDTLKDIIQTTIFDDRTEKNG